MSPAMKLRQAAALMREREQGEVMTWVASVLEDHAQEHDSYDCRFLEPCSPLMLANLYLGGGS